MLHCITNVNRTMVTNHWLPKSKSCVSKCPNTSNTCNKVNLNCFIAEDCLDPWCNGHGSCVLGRCYCKAGWQGANCSQLDQKVYQCLPGCSEHGTYDLETGACICEEFWTGLDCSQGGLIH